VPRKGEKGTSKKVQERWVRLHPCLLGVEWGGGVGEVEERLSEEEKDPFKTIR